MHSVDGLCNNIMHHKAVFIRDGTITKSVKDNRPKLPFTQHVKFSHLFLSHWCVHMNVPGHSHSYTVMVYILAENTEFLTGSIFNSSAMLVRRWQTMDVRIVTPWGVCFWPSNMGQGHLQKIIMCWGQTDSMFYGIFVPAWSPLLADKLSARA